MTTRILARCLLVLCCLLAAAAPALGGEAGDAAPTLAGSVAPTMAELKREANQAAARWSRARAEQVRINQEVKGLEEQVADLERRVELLRQAASRGAAAMYKQDAMVESVSGLGNTAAVLGSARRAKLIGHVNDLAGDAVVALGDAARQLKAQRQVLDGRRRAQDEVVDRLAGERRVVEGRLEAMARAARALRARELAAARAETRAGRNQPAAPIRPLVLGGSFVCPINGPVAYSNDWGDGRGHKGNDLMNPRGTENVAVVAGTISTRRWGGGAGLTAFLTGDDGHTYIYMHLLGLVGPYPRHVAQGEVIALTGKSGNASAYHTHFEFHPNHGPAVNPYPLISAHC